MTGLRFTAKPLRIFSATRTQLQKKLQQNLSCKKIDVAKKNRNKTCIAELSPKKTCVVKIISQQDPCCKNNSATRPVLQNEGTFGRMTR